MHGEYVGADFPNGDVNVIKPKINPKYMEFYEIKKLMNIPSNAVIQERHFREAFIHANEKLSEGTEKTIDFLKFKEENIVGKKRNNF